MIRPKHTKPDANQSQIVEELRELGYDVDIVHNLPGLYDIVVSGEKCIDFTIEGLLTNTMKVPISAIVSVRVEIKSGDGKLNDTEQEYHESQNHPESLIVARGTEDVLRWFGAI